MQVFVIVLGVALILIGLVFAIRGLASDSAAGGASGVTIQGPAWLLLVAIGVGLVLFGAAGPWDGGDGSVTGSTTSSTGTTEAPDPTTTGAPVTSPPTTAPSTVAPTPATVSGCHITVSNPLATIHERPDVFSQEIVRLPGGTYEVQEVTTVTFGPERQRWLRVTASGRTGWLEDTTFNIAAKSADCP